MAQNILQRPYVSTVPDSDPLTWQQQQKAADSAIRIGFLLLVSSCNV